MGLQGHTEEEREMPQVCPQPLTLRCLIYECDTATTVS